MGPNHGFLRLFRRLVIGGNAVRGFGTRSAAFRRKRDVFAANTDNDNTIHSDAVNASLLTEEGMGQGDFDEDGHFSRAPTFSESFGADLSENVPSESTYRILQNESLQTGPPETYRGLKYRRTITEEPDGTPSESDITKIVISLKDYLFGNQNHTHTVFQGGSNFRAGRKVEQRTFIDLRLLRLSSGKGGNGLVSFFRDAHRPVGPPDGGDGGRGGNVYVQAVPHVTSLHRLRRSYSAKDGNGGSGKQLDGKNGEDTIIEVPVGTTIRWIPDPLEVRRNLRENDVDMEMELKTLRNGYGEVDLQLFRNSYLPGKGWIFKERDEEYQRARDYFNELNQQVEAHDAETLTEELFGDRFPIAGMDFTEPTQKSVLLLNGGKGGMGNMHFLTRNIRNPRFCKQGRAGLTGFFLLELKLIADLGLVGLPNAGKLTLLRAISRARPRVGHWEFTTLQPTVGTIFTTIDKDPFTVADIPGIIQGASENKGMGLDFLRHIERSGGLVFVVSLELKDPGADLEVLVAEVGAKRMQNKKVLVVATKADLTDNGGTFSELRQLVEDKGWKIVPVCAQRGENIERCIRMMSETANV